MMAKRQEVWNKAVQTIQAFAPYYQEKTTAATQEAPPHWNFLQLAAGQEPQPLTRDLLYAVYPYTARPAVEEALQQHVDEGYLSPDGEDGYCLTDEGRAVLARFFQAAHEAMNEIEVLSAPEAARLSQLLLQLVESTEDTPEPPQKPAFQASRWSDPGDEAAAPTRIDQLITDLYFFRDDAHIAAWRPTGLDGAAWEALTLIWRDQAHTAAELAELLANRQYTTADYGLSLEELARRGLLQEQEGTYEVTDEGRRLREEAEEKTDDLFYAPWSVLSQKELQEADELLGQSRDRLQDGARSLLWPLAYSVSRSIYPVTRELVTLVLNEYLDNPRLFLYLRMAREVAPEPYDAERFLMRYPYNNPQRVRDLLEEAVQGGLLTPSGDGTYTVTDKGKAAVDAVNDRFYEALKATGALLEEDVERLASLLEKVVQAALEADIPRKTALKDSHNAPLERDYGPLARVDLLLDDLSAFRDDVHIAAWSAREITARDFEALTQVWRGEARSAAELAENNEPFRGYGEEAYAQSLQRLQQRGWVEKVDGAYQITADGAALRSVVEQTTDEYFYGPWQVLSAQEIAELRTSLIRLKVGLQDLVEEQS